MGKIRGGQELQHQLNILCHQITIDPIAQCLGKPDLLTACLDLIESVLFENIRILLAISLQGPDGAAQGAD